MPARPRRSSEGSRKRPILAALSILARAVGLLAGPLPPASADDSAVGGVGGDVYPLANSDIRMLAETVQVICWREMAECERPKKIRVTLSDGTSKDFTLADDPSMQRFPLVATADEATIEILSSYRGSKSRDTYIAYVEFGNQIAPEFESFASLIMEQAPETTPTVPPTATTGTTTTATEPPAPTSSSTTATSPTTVADSSVHVVAIDDDPIVPWWWYLGIPGVGIVALLVIAAIVYLGVRMSRKDSEQ